MSHAEVRGWCRRRHTGARHAPRRPRGVPRDGGAGHGAAGRRKAARHDTLPPLGYRVRGKGGADTCPDNVPGLRGKEHLGTARKRQGERSGLFPRPSRSSLSPAQLRAGRVRAGNLCPARPARRRGSGVLERIRRHGEDGSIGPSLEGLAGHVFRPARRGLEKPFKETGWGQTWSPRSQRTKTQHAWGRGQQNET